MKIIEVEYRRLVNLGNYEHEVVSGRAGVEIDENPDDALTALKAWCYGRSDRGEALLKLEHRKMELRAELADLETKTQAAQERWDRAVVFLEKLGLEVPIPQNVLDELPF